MKAVLTKKYTPVALYAIAWALSVAAFWLGAGSDAMGYSLVYLYTIAPTAALTCSFFLGKDTRWGAEKWAVGLLIAIAHPAAWYATFGLANALSTGVPPLPDLESVPVMVVLVAVGMAAGNWSRWRRISRE